MGCEKLERVDATVTARALVTDLFALPPEGNHELVVFGVNRKAKLESLFMSSNLDQLETLERLRDDPNRTCRLRVVTNVAEEDRAVLLRSWAPGDYQFTDGDLGLAQSHGIYSLSHLSLPFPESDPLYRGEKSTMHVSAQETLRLGSPSTNGDMRKNEQ